MCTCGRGTDDEAPAAGAEWVPAAGASEAAPRGVALATAWLIWPTIAHGIEVWSTTEEFGFGFLVPPVAALLVRWRRSDLRRSLGPGTWAGLPIILGALGIYLLARRIGVNALAGLAVSP